MSLFSRFRCVPSLVSSHLCVVVLQRTAQFYGRKRRMLGCTPLSSQLACGCGCKHCVTKPLEQRRNRLQAVLACLDARQQDVELVGDAGLFGCWRDRHRCSSNGGPAEFDLVRCAVAHLQDLVLHSGAANPAEQIAGLECSVGADDGHMRVHHLGGRAVTLLDEIGPTYRPGPRAVPEHVTWLNASRGIPGIELFGMNELKMLCFKTGPSNALLIDHREFTVVCVLW